MKKIFRISFIVFALISVFYNVLTLFAKDKSHFIPSKKSTLKTTSVSLPSQKPVDFTYAAEHSIDAVVHVKVASIEKRRVHRNPFFHFYYGEPSVPKVRIGSGSGVIVSDDGYIITNNHVIFSADKIEVVLNDKRVFPATIVGRDPSTDLALIKIDETSLPYLLFENSDIVKIGEWVLAVGNPFNLSSTVTAGIVSAKARNINLLTDVATGIESFIQTDAVINRGNSGGALTNTSGKTNRNKYCYSISRWNIQRLLHLLFHLIL